MAAFDDFLNSFSYNPETFNEDQFKAAIKSAHDEDTNTLSATSTAKDQEIADRDARIKKLGEDNWKLLMKQGPPVDSHSIPDPKPDEQEHKPKSIDEMFKRVERK